MLNDQENSFVGTSRLPRLTSPKTRSSAPMSSIPLATSSNVNKRKATSSPKAVASLKDSIASKVTGSDGEIGRKPSMGGFVPTSRKPSTRLGRTTRSTSAASDHTTNTTRKTSTSELRNGTTGGIRAPSAPGVRPTAATAGRTARPGVPSASTSTSGIRRPVAPAGPSSAVSRPGTLGRSTGPGRRPIPGSGAAGALQSQRKDDGRLENMEKMLKAMFEKEQENISSQAVSQADFQKLMRSIHDPERDARRELTNASEEMAILTAKHAREIDELESQIRKKDREKRDLEEELQEGREKLSEERETIRGLKRTLAEQSTQHMTLNAQLVASQAQQTALQAEIERATIHISSMKAEVEVSRQKVREAGERADQKVREAEEAADARIAEIEEELRTAETIRRKLHNKVQELKGNIRVFARVRPALAHEEDDLANLVFSDERKDIETGQSELVVSNRSESATGREREQVNNFIFDKVFQPKADQKEVFEEISMLAQSVLDGYNVCVFAYGQTGSGKSWTMEGGQLDHELGMIPRAIEMIFAVSSQLRDRGWKYHMEGQYLEVYNEVINDLLGSGQFDTKKHEIKQDKDGKMSVSDVVSVPLSNARQVSTLLERARSRRAVAATLMNERSSRSHSVFTLKVRGVNPLTDEKCEAMLNLVDLAGSERLEKSGAGENKDRLKETININKSLSALADVIGALGQGQSGGHVPYRNSTLTRLLQTSLSGSSKTLMMCNISPLQAHVGETLCSLRFATKVNSTVVGKVQKAIAK